MNSFFLNSFFCWIDATEQRCLRARCNRLQPTNHWHQPTASCGQVKARPRGGPGLGVGRGDSPPANLASRRWLATTGERTERQPSRRRPRRPGSAVATAHAGSHSPHSCAAAWRSRSACGATPASPVRRPHPRFLSLQLCARPPPRPGSTRLAWRACRRKPSERAAREVQREQKFTVQNRWLAGEFDQRHEVFGQRGARESAVRARAAGALLAGLGANHSLNFAEAWPRAARHSVQDAPSLPVAQKAGSEMGEIVPGSVVGFRDFCMQITIPSSIPFLDVKLGACASRAAPLRRLAAGSCLLVRRVTISYPRLLFCDQARWWRWSRNWATPRPCGRSWGIRARRRAPGPRQPSRACATRHCEATGQGVADVTDRGNSYACAQVPRTGVHGR